MAWWQARVKDEEVLYGERDKECMGECLTSTVFDN